VATVGKHRKKASLFQLIDRKSFDALVEKWSADKWVRGLPTWELTCALINVMIMRLGSYRDVELILGIPRSTFSDALSSRNSGFFEDLCDLVLNQIRAKSPDRKIRKALRDILAIDSTEVRVHGSLFSSPGWKQKHTTGHQASAKLHVVWDINGNWVDDFLITPGRRNDSPVSLQLRLQSNKTYVFDRAYNDIDFWLKIIDYGSHFVTRLKDYARNHMLAIKVNLKHKERDGVLYDEDYRPGTPLAVRLIRDGRDLRLRHIIYRDPETKKIFHFVTSDLKVSAQTIADIYKRRWVVELLFRWLKGHLNIRQLASRNKNAAKSQLAVAVLVKLLLQLKKLTNELSGTLWEILRTIRATIARNGLTNSEVPDGCRWKAALVKNYTSRTL
jgi:putative transposase